MRRKLDTLGQLSRRAPMRISLTMRVITDSGLGRGHVFLHVMRDNETERIRVPGGRSRGDKDNRDQRVAKYTVRKVVMMVTTPEMIAMMILVLSDIPELGLAGGGGGLVIEGGV